MIDYKALDDLLFLSERFKGLLSLVPYLEELKKFDDTIKERRETIQRLQGEVNERLEMVGKLNQDAINLQKRKENAIKEAKEQETAILDHARAKADQIIDKANKKTDELNDKISLLQNQRLEAERFLQEVRSQAGTARSDYEHFRLKLENAKKDLQAIKNAI